MAARAVDQMPRCSRALGVALLALGLTACFGSGATPEPSPCQSVRASAAGAAGAPQPLGAPISPEQAAQDARTEVAIAGDAPASEGGVPLVTVERRGGAPRITTTPVGSADEAAAVASSAAADGDVIAVEVDTPVRADAASNDPNRPQQWALDHVAFEDAWTAGGATGTGLVVAVIDTGVKGSHPDLSGKVLQGWSFLHSWDGAAFSTAGGKKDDNGHGTHVAGIIGAHAGNAVGITGAAPGVKLLPVQVLCGDGTGWSSDVANGITWAADHGAHVINLSLGGSSPSAAQQAAIQYARSRGVVVVAAAGNAGAGGAPSYPGAFPEVVGVGATQGDDTRAPYSTTGAYLDLAAPGGAGSGPTGVLSTWNTGGYVAISGTSMASPHVAAAAALVRATHGDYTPVDICTQLLRTADDLGPAGPDQEYGHGLVDPLEAVGATVPTGPTCA